MIDDKIVIQEILSEDSKFYKIKSGDRNLIMKEESGEDHKNRLQHEFLITSSIDLKCILKALDLEFRDEKSVIYYEYFTGTTLDKLIKNCDLDLNEKLTIALKTANILCNLHNVGIIHNNISLDNLLYDRNQKVMKLTGLAKSSIFLDEHKAVENNSLISFTDRKYISPEQTGLVNLPIDYRTDIYSAGIMFYRLFTGFYPFTGEKIINKHIDEKPPCVRAENNIFRSVQKIILKMIEKDPAKRYQSAISLKKDLVLILKNGGISEPGLSDIDPYLKEQVYVHSDFFFKVFRKIRNSSRRELLHLTGKSGSGKSLNINYLTRRLEKRNIIYVKIENSQISSKIPYYSFVKSLIRHNKAYINEIPYDLRKLIVSNERDNIKNQIRDEKGITYSLIKIVKKIFLESNIVFIIEDAEYIDNASLDVVLYMIRYSGFKKMLLVITSDRDNENIRKINDVIRKSSGKTEKRELKPFDLKMVKRYTAKRLFTTIDRTKELALYLSGLSDGNPDFMDLLIHYLIKRDLLVYNPHRGNFQWNLNIIKSSGIPDNIDQIVLEILYGLDEENRKFLLTASVFGSVFCIETVKKTLDIKEKIDLIDFNGILIKDESKSLCRFRSEKVRKIISSTMSEENVKLTRKNFARIILKGMEYEDHYGIFLTIYFLNKSKDYIIKEHELESFAELNLFCGLYLNSISRNHEALKYFIQSSSKSESYSDNSFLNKLYENMIKSAYLSGDFYTMENTYERLCSINTDKELKLNELIDKMIHLSGDKEKRHVINIKGFDIPDKKLFIKDLSNEIVIKALEKFNGNKSRAAGYLGISRQALYRRLAKIKT